MIVIFKSDVYETIHMFGDVAMRLLKIMGYEKTQGTIEYQQIPLVLARLKQGISNAAPEKNLSTTNGVDDDEREENISLAHRAFTLIEMLEASQKQECDVTWKAS